MTDLQSAVASFDALKKEFNSGNTPTANQKCRDLLQKLKVQLTKLSFLSAVDNRPNDPKALLLAREVLEIGAYWSVRVKDLDQFERYIAQLQTYYFDHQTSLPPSQRMYPLLGLNLLRLLAQGRISDFHMQLELFDPALISENIYIKHPVKIEQSLMEGSYSKVWNARQDVPAEEYLVFMDLLMQTIRNEIASCSEKAYNTLPVQDAIGLFFLKDMTELSQFAQSRGWIINVADKKIHFNQPTELSQVIPAAKLLTQLLGYSQELERII